MGISSRLQRTHSDRAGLGKPRATQENAACPCCGERLTGSRGNQSALLLSKCGEKVQDKWIDVRAQLSDPKGHLVSHQAADEMHIAAQPIKLGDGDMASVLPGR